MNKIRRQHVRRVSVSEAFALNEGIEVRDLVVLKCCLPGTLIHDYVFGDGLLVSEELIEANDGHADVVGAVECRDLGVIAVRSLVSALDQVAGLLEFDRQKERAGSVDSTYVSALGISSTRIDLVVPERQA